MLELWIGLRLAFFASAAQGSELRGLVQFVLLWLFGGEVAGVQCARHREIVARASWFTSKANANLFHLSGNVWEPKENLHHKGRDELKNNSHHKGRANSHHRGLGLLGSSSYVDAPFYVFANPRSLD